MAEKLTINQWAEEDRPREKMMLHGVGTLSDAELLAILIGSGNTEDSAVELMRKVLSDYHNKVLNASAELFKPAHHLARVGAHAAPFSAQQHPRLKAAAQKIGRGGHSVAPVVAGSAEDIRVLFPPRKRLRRFGQVLGRVLHQQR